MRIGDMAKWKMKLDYARRYRERIESERDDWTRLVHETGGNIARIADTMGYHHSSARRILWDLGLWPTVQRYKQTGQKWTDMSLRSLIIEHHGKVLCIAKARGRAFQSTRQLLIRRGLWPLVERARKGYHA